MPVRREGVIDLQLLELAGPHASQNRFSLRIDFNLKRLAKSTDCFAQPLCTPLFAALWSDAGFGGASRTWHAYQRTHVIPDADKDRPVLYNSWEATQFDISEKQQEVLAQRAAAAGVELFVVDDGWIGLAYSPRRVASNVARQNDKPASPKPSAPR